MAKTIRKCLIVFFSRMGSTEKVVQAAAAELRNIGCQVDIFNLLNETPPDPGEYDLFGVATPVYYYKTPFPVKDYLKKLPRMDGIPVFVLILYGTYEMGTGKRVSRVLQKKGGKPAGIFTSFGTGYFLGYEKEGYLFSDGHPTQQEIAKAKSFARKIGMIAANPRNEGNTAIKKEVPDGDITYNANQPRRKMMYRVERFLTNRFFTRLIYSRMFRVDKELCRSCGLCAKECPSGNIKYDENGYPYWGRECILCMFCGYNCPAEAITAPITRSIFRPFLRYNVSRAGRDPAIDSVKVTLRRSP